jgi:hypothetical protein
VKPLGTVDRINFDRSLAAGTVVVLAFAAVVGADVALGAVVGVDVDDLPPPEHAAAIIPNAHTVRIFRRAHTPMHDS